MLQCWVHQVDICLTGISQPPLSEWVTCIGNPDHVPRATSMGRYTASILVYQRQRLIPQFIDFKSLSRSHHPPSPGLMLCCHPPVVHDTRRGTRWWARALRPLSSFDAYWILCVQIYRYDPAFVILTMWMIPETT